MPHRALRPERPPKGRGPGPGPSLALRAPCVPLSTPSSEQRLSRRTRRREVKCIARGKPKAERGGAGPQLERRPLACPCLCSGGWGPAPLGAPLRRGGSPGPNLPALPHRLGQGSPVGLTHNTQGPWSVWAGAGHVLEGGGHVAAAKEKDRVKVRGRQARNQGAGGHL